MLEEISWLEKETFLNYALECYINIYGRVNSEKARCRYLRQL